MTDRNIVSLTFDNPDYGDDGGVITIRVEKSAVKHIMNWYGAFCGGDDYDVLINGRKQRLGINGELEPLILDMERL